MTSDRPEARGRPAVAAECPLVSIITATYERPDVLKTTIDSVIAQDMANWEMIVVGDHCTESTGALLASFDDPRIRYINLPFNYGEQSGPNNVGLAHARGRFIAYLSHDDIWFPDHLTAALRWIEMTGADVAMTYAASILPASEQELQEATWIAILLGNGRRGRYDPTVSIAYASSVVFTAAAAATVGRWRSSDECCGEPSQDLLFRAWRKGLALRWVPHLTAILIHSGTRPGSYLAGTSHEHAYFAERMRDPPALRLLIADRLQEQPRPRWMMTKTWVFVRRRLLLLLAQAGVSPREIEFRLMGFRRGALIDRLRKTRGLKPVRQRSGSLEALRQVYASEKAAVVQSQRVDPHEPQKQRAR